MSADYCVNCYDRLALENALVCRPCRRAYEDGYARGLKQIKNQEKTPPRKFKGPTVRIGSKK